MDKFDWKATESAPENFPMQIVKGDFIYPKGGSLYVPDGKTVHDGWGVDISSHVVGPDLKPLPNRLDISFFSYTENQFYSGKFDLPYEKTHKLFNDGYFSPTKNKQITYERIMAGVTPGGAVAVWLIGNDKTTEIFFGQAEKIDGDWKWINDNPDYTREEYIRLEIQDTLTPETITALQKDGIPSGRWETYHRKRYHWQPIFTGMQVRDNLIYTVKYFNGEEDYLYVPVDDVLVKKERAVPSELHFVWERQPKEKNLVYKLFFDEVEIFELFEKLGKDNQPLQLEMRMIDTDKGRQFGVLLRNEKEGSYFKNIKLKKFAARR